MRSNGTPSAFETRSQISRDSVVGVVAAHLADVLDGDERGRRAVAAEGHGQPRHEAGHHPAFRLAEARGGQLRQLGEQRLAPSAGGAADVNTWTSGMRSVHQIDCR